MKTGVPAMRTGVLCNENRFFPVWKTSQGKPCSGPVLALYRIAVLLGYDGALWPKNLEISHASQILTKNDCQILWVF